MTITFSLESHYVRQLLRQVIDIKTHDTESHFHYRGFKCYIGINHLNNWCGSIHIPSKELSFSMNLPAIIRTYHGLSEDTTMIREDTVVRRIGISTSNVSDFNLPDLSSPIDVQYLKSTFKDYNFVHFQLQNIVDQLIKLRGHPNKNYKRALL